MQRAAGKLGVMAASLLLVAVATHWSLAARQRGGTGFVDVSARTGIHFTQYNDFQPERFFLPEVMGSGAAWIDFDGDGWLDLYLVNGCKLPYDASDHERTSELYRNASGQSFVAVGAEALAQHNGYGQGTAVADYDNDGFDDLLVTCFGENRLYRNSGDGTFVEVSATAGVRSDARWHSSAAFGDVDRDGDVDLYVTGYVKTSLESHPRCKDQPTKSVRVYCGPADHPAEDDLLFANDGTGAFQDVTRAAGCDLPNGKGLGVVIADVDQDQWPDIFVANDMTPSFLFKHRAGAAADAMRFDEIGVKSGLAFDGEGRPAAGMGIASGDYNGDGWLDFYVTHFYQQGNTLYHNVEGRVFIDRSTPTGLTRLSWNYLGFGTGFIDYDLDGWLDLFAANGHVLGPHIEPYWMRPQLYRNESGKRFSDATPGAGEYFQQRWLGRSAVFGDFDNDGAEDILVGHQFRPVALLRNETSQRGHYVQLELIGRESNRTAVGARVRVQAGSRTLVREIVGGGSYLAANDRRLTVGLGVHREPVQVEIDWPSGRRQRLNRVAVDRSVRIVEQADSARD